MTWEEIDEQFSLAGMRLHVVVDIILNNIEFGLKRDVPKFKDLSMLDMMSYYQQKKEALDMEFFTAILRETGNAVFSDNHGSIYDGIKANINLIDEYPFIK